MWFTSARLGWKSLVGARLGYVGMALIRLSWKRLTWVRLG